MTPAKCPYCGTELDESNYSMEPGGEEMTGDCAVYYKTGKRHILCANCFNEVEVSGSYGDRLN